MDHDKLEKIKIRKTEISDVLGKINITGNAAQLSFYILLSLVPMLLVIGNLLMAFPLVNIEATIISQSLIPKEVQELLHPVFEKILTKSSGVTISFGLLTAIWSASNFFSTVQNILNTAYGTKKRKNVIVARIFSFVVSLILITAFGVLVFLLTFGEKILSLLKKLVPYLELDFTLPNWIVTVVFLFALFFIMFYFVPNVKWGLRYSLPGTIFSTIGVFSANILLKMYVHWFGEKILGLGSLSFFIMLMLWLYFVMIIFLLGAFINVMYHNIKNKKLPSS